MPSAMTFLRLPVLLALLLLGSVATAPAAQSTVDWLTDTGSGGTLAQPPRQGPGGGTGAPVGEGPVAEPPVEVPPYVNLDPPTAMSAQAGPDEGAADGAQLPAGADGSAPAGDAQAAPAQQTAGDSQASADSGAVGSLPFTGLELAALVGVGVCLLSAGIALRPRRTARP